MNQATIDHLVDLLLRQLTAAQLAAAQVDVHRQIAADVIRLAAATALRGAAARLQGFADKTNQAPVMEPW